MQWNLIKLRKEYKETQANIAKLIGVTTSAYRSKELGNTQFKSDEMFIIAEHYNKSISEIFLKRKYTKGIHKEA